MNTAEPHHTENRKVVAKFIRDIRNRYPRLSNPDIRDWLDRLCSLNAVPFKQIDVDAVRLGPALRESSNDDSAFGPDTLRAEGLL